MRCKETEEEEEEGATSGVNLECNSRVFAHRLHMVFIERGRE